MNEVERSPGERAQRAGSPVAVVGGRRGELRTYVNHLCRSCRRRKSRFYIRGAVKSDRTHTLCFECYRALVNRVRAQRLAAPDVWPLPSQPPLPARLRADREAFSEELALRRRRAQIAARHALEGFVGNVLLESAPLQKVS